MILQKLIKIGLLGTVFTMKGDFFKAPFTDSGIEIVVPAEEEMIVINEKISSELKLGIVSNTSLKFFQEIISRMKQGNGI